jgi:spore germination protein GerM
MKQRQHRFSKGSISSLLLIPFLLTVVACDGKLKLPTFESNAPSEEAPPRGAIEDPQVETPPPASPSESTAPAAPQELAPSVTENQSESLTIYWLTAKDDDLALSASPLEIEDADLSSQDKLTTALERLLKGPANANVSTAIPVETKLYQLTIKNDGVHVNLSKDFTLGGGSRSMQGRLGQLIYTASSLSPQTPVWISIDGEPLQVLGGEGLEVSQPMTREEFDQSFSI